MGQMESTSMRIERFLNTYNDAITFIQVTICRDELARTRFDEFISCAVTYSRNLFPTELPPDDSDSDN